MRNCGIREDSNMSVRRLEHCMSILGATTSHTDIYYSMRDTLEGFNLDFHMDALRGNSVSAAVNFDTEEIASVLVNGTLRLGNRVPMEASLTGRFGKRLALGARYAVLTSPLSDVRLEYLFNHDDVTIHSGGHRLYNAAYNRHMATFSFVNMNSLRQNLRTEIGVSFRKYDYLSLLADYREWDSTEGRPIPEANLMADLNTRLLGYFVRADYETLDSRYFTHRGTSVSVEAELYTDNLYRWRGGRPLGMVSLAWITAVPLSQRFSVIPSLYGRAVSPDAPFPLYNMIGGRSFGRYMAQQMPFDGVGFVEMAPAVFVAGRMEARLRIGRRHHAAASFNYGFASEDLHSFTLRYGGDYMGASIEYGYDLRGFPLKASMGWSNLTKSPGLYLQAGYMF
jgi:NTE family protein